MARLGFLGLTLVGTVGSQSPTPPPTIQWTWQSPVPTPASFRPEDSGSVTGYLWWGDCQGHGDASVMAGLYITEYKVENNWNTYEEQFYQCMEVVQEGTGLPEYWQIASQIDLFRWKLVGVMEANTDCLQYDSSSSLVGGGDIQFSQTGCGGADGWMFYYVPVPTPEPTTAPPTPDPTPASYREKKFGSWAAQWGDCHGQDDASVKAALYVMQNKIDGDWVSQDDASQYQCFEPMNDDGGLPEYWQNLNLVDSVRFMRVGDVSTSCDFHFLDINHKGTYRQDLPASKLTTCNGRGTDTEIGATGWRWFSAPKQAAVAEPLPASCDGDETIVSMLYILENTDSEGGYENSTGSGWYCVDAAQGILADEYDFSASFNNEPTPAPSAGPTISTASFFENGTMKPEKIYWSVLTNAYSGSSKTCCERKSVENTASSCPFESQNSAKNWYVPVPSECSTTLHARVTKLGQGSGGFLS